MAECFVMRGHGMSVRRIAREMDVSVITMYRYFSQAEIFGKGAWEKQ